MGNYNDFLRQYEKEGARVRRLYWVYGEEPVFKELVLARIRELSGVSQFNVTRLSADSTSESEIWAALNQHPLDSDQTRLLVIREAQRLKHVDRLEAWLKDNQTIRGRNATAVFLSESSDWEDAVREVVSKSSSAQVVKCSLPKNEADRTKRAKEIICAWGNIDPVTAGVLAERVNYSMSDAYGVMWKASVFPQAHLSAAAVEKLAPRRVDEEFVWNLLALKKRLAAEAIAESQASDVGQILSALSTHLAALVALNPIVATTRSVKDAAFRVGEREQYVRLLMPLARLYPPPEANRRMALLARMDHAHLSGAREGVLEALTALW